MTSPNTPHQSGHWRAYIDTDPFGRKSTLFVMKDGDIARFYNQTLSIVVIDEAVRADDEHAMMVWDDVFEDDIVDMWKAIGKALDVYSDKPSQAYAQGFANGESKVLREWNESLRVVD